MILLATWTDDLIIASSSRAFRDTFVANLSETFDLRDEGAADELLGVELSAVDGGFKLSMPKYVRSMLREAGMQDCIPVGTFIITINRCRSRGSWPTGHQPNAATRLSRCGGVSKLNSIAFLIIGSKPTAWYIHLRVQPLCSILVLAD